MGIYRSDIEAARHERDERAAAYEAARRAAAETVAVIARRGQRVAVGAAMIVASAVFWAAAITSCFGGEQHMGGILGLTLDAPRDLLLVLGLPAAWLACAVVLVVARARGRAWQRRLAGPFSAGDDPWADIARLAAAPDAEALRERADRMEGRSIALPLAGWSLLAPITLHLVLAGWFFGAAFASWIRLSLVFAGLAELVAVAYAFAFARRVRGCATPELRRLRRWGFWAVLGTTLASCLPFALLVLPPLVVLASGVAVLPVGYWAMARAVERERLGLGAV